MTFQEAVDILQNYVKESAVPGQMHISADLVSTKDLPRFQEAMETTTNAILKGDITREELLQQLGLNS